MGTPPKNKFFGPTTLHFGKNFYFYVQLRIEQIFDYSIDDWLCFAIVTSIVRMEFYSGVCEFGKW